MSCQGILGVVYLSMKSGRAEKREGWLKQAAPSSQQRQPTVKRLVQLDPVPVDKVAVVFSVPEARVSAQLPHSCFHSTHWLPH